VSIDGATMDQAWNSMPQGHRGRLRDLKPKLDEIARQLSEGVVGVMRVTQASSGDLALVATTARLILVSKRGSAQVLRYGDLHSLMFTEAKKRRFGLDKEAYLLIEGPDYKYTFVVYSDPEWVNVMGARIESAFESAQLRL